MTNLWAFILVAFGCSSCATSQDELKDRFKNPPAQYRPMPFWHINGQMTKEGIEERLDGAKNLGGFGGVTVLPVSPGPQVGTGNTCPGTEPAFLSEEYFERYTDILNVSQKQGTQVVLYDDIDFPSGSAGGQLMKEYPQYMRKFLEKHEFITKGNQQINQPCPVGLSDLMAVSAMNTATLEVQDLMPCMKDSVLEWKAPEGEWRVMFFVCKSNMKSGHSHVVDYMQPEAVSQVLKMTYDKYDKRFNRFFGNVITKTFFDDVGFVHEENTWTPAITRLFKEKYGKNPALYYPALYYDIGPETGSARVAFFDIRSELMAEGYVKQVSEWSARRNLRSMGHPPENYSPNSVVANGDILKYYRHVQIPLLDAIFFYGRGLNGYKQISSAADIGDKPEVGAELCGAFSADMDSLTLYRVALDAMARGVNFVVPHGMWYSTEKEKVRIPPLISHENPLLTKALHGYSTCMARACMLLQGGCRVSEIAVLWPITAIQAESYINRDATSGLPVANWLPEHVNHPVLSDLLTNQIRRDFTFIHPEDLCNGKVTPDGNVLRLNNMVNRQDYKVLLLPGGDVISAEALKAIRQYYANGGKVIATASLPVRSSEFGQDKEVQDLVSGLFGVDPLQEASQDIFRINEKGGQLAFLRTPTKESLNNLFVQMNLAADITFDESLIPPTTIGYLNYIHKQKDGNDLFFITNTTDKAIATTVSLRGAFKQIEYWNPHDGSTQTVPDCKPEKLTDGSYVTDIQISIPMVSSLFIVGKVQ